MPCSATALRCEATSRAVQDASVNLGVQRLYPPVEHLGKAGQLGNVFHGDAGVAQQLRGAAGRDQFDAHAGEFAGKFHQSGLVRHAENGTLNFCMGRGHGRPRMNGNVPGTGREILSVSVVGRQSSVVSQDAVLANARGLDARVAMLSKATDAAYTMEALRTDDRRLATSFLAFRFCLQLHFAVLHFDRVFDRFATVLFADLVGFLLHE